MNTIHTPLIILSLCLFSALSCSRETETIAIDSGREYFPLQVGRAWEYEVDSIIFSTAGTDSSRTLQRDLITNSFTDAAGDTIFRVERYERLSPAEDWQIRKVLSLSANNRQAVRTEDNLRFIKLIFPVREGATWNGNLHIDQNLRIIVAGEVLDVFKDWKYKIITKGQPYFNGIQAFDDAVTTSHADSENLIEYRYVQEAYARNVGLVFQAQQILDTQCQRCCNANFAQCLDLPWTEKAEKGFILRRRLTGWE